MRVFGSDGRTSESVHGDLSPLGDPLSVDGGRGYREEFSSRRSLPPFLPSSCLPLSIHSTGESREGSQVLLE